MNLKKVMKVVLSFVLVCVVILPMLDNSMAISGVESKINSLRSKFPDGAYWNHYGSNNNPDGYTWQPCQTHKANGNPDCNTFDGALQCCGFAKKVFYDIFGVHVNSISARTDRNNVSIGDYVSLNGGSHFGVVIWKGNGEVSIVEANYGSNCRIKWDRHININTIDNFKHSSNYNSINTVSMVTPTISTNKSSYIKGDTVNLSWKASPSNSNLSHYWLTIIAPSGTWVYGGTMNKNTSYSFKVNEVGNYEVTVYATPLGSKEGEGSLIAKKTVTVTSAIPQPGKPFLKVIPGMTSYKTTFSWNTTTNTNYYSIRIYKAGSTSEFKLITNIKGNSYSLVLPAGSYYAKVNSSNSTYKTYTFSDNVSFTIGKTLLQNSDGWYYVDKLPSYVNNNQYTIQYKSTITKEAKTSPGKEYEKGNSVDKYENVGSTYWSNIELPITKTRSLVSYYYYHFCGKDTGIYANYGLTSKYNHEDTIKNVNSVYVSSSGNDSDDPRYKYYYLKWKSNNNWAKCKSGTTCNGVYGSHGERSYAWYKKSQYQNRKLVKYYKYTKQTGWMSSKDVNATSVKYRFKPSNKGALTFTYSKISNKTYTGKQQRPSLSIKYGGNTLRRDTDYTLSYGTNRSIGKAYIKIIGKGNYMGTTYCYFNIVPKRMAISSAKSGAKKKITVKYKKLSGASGYRIAYRKKGTSKWYYKNTTKTYYTLSKLKSKKYYYVEVRAYKTVSGKKYYGSYSKAKRVKVK